MGQYVSVRDATGAVEKQATSAFQRRHSRLERIRIDPLPEHISIYKKRHIIMAATLWSGQGGIWIRPLHYSFS